MLESENDVIWCDMSSGGGRIEKGVCELWWGVFILLYD